MSTPRKVVSLPRPKGTRKSTKRAQLVLTMHPRQLRELEARAKARSMSLAGYVRALLDDDDDGRDAPDVRAAIGAGLTSAFAGFMFEKGAAIARAPESRDFRLSSGLASPPRARGGILGFLVDNECPVCSRVPAEGHAPGCSGTFPEVSS